MQTVRPFLYAFSLLAMTLVAQTSSGQTKKFDLPEGTVTLSDVSATTEVYYQSMRYNSVQRQWNFELVLRNTAAQTLNGPVVVLITDYSNTAGPASVDGRDETGAGFWNINSQLPVDGLITGAESRPRTMALVKNGTSFPALHVKVYAPGISSGPAIALAGAVDEVGHALGSVHIVDVSGGGVEVGITDSGSGVATLTADPSDRVYSFNVPGYVPVWRRQTLAPGSIRIIPSARMAKIDSREFTVPVSGASVSNVTGTVVLNIPANAITSSAQVRVTALTGQTLPAYLPQGWSPLGAFWLDLSQASSAPLGLRLQLTDGLQRGEPGLLAWWDQMLWRCLPAASKPRPAKISSE